MRTLGKISMAELGLMQARGMRPKQAVDAILAEAKSRFPKAGTIVIDKAASHDGFDIIAVDG